MSKSWQGVRAVFGHPLIKRVGAFVRIPYVWIPLLFLSSLGAGLGLGSWRNLCATCPSIALLYGYEPIQTSKVYADGGELIAEFGAEARTPVSVQDLPDHVAQAFVSIEDKRFYRHKGVDPIAVGRAVVGVLTGQSRRSGGGSTLTQQLARNMFPRQIGTERRATRKLKEMKVALEMERIYTKDQILEAYINQVNYGQGWLGIQTASRNYFGKSASELTIPEAALLAAIPNRPSDFTPLQHPENAIRRRNLVLDRMTDQGYITTAQAAEFKQAPVPTERAVLSKGVAPYFVEHVRRELDDRFGSQLYTAGLRIYTTLHIGMQHSANRAMEAGWAAIEARPGYEHPLYSNYADSTTIGASESPYVQGAFIVIDPEIGAVRALIGGRDFRHSKFNRATQALRQAGSSFKPFVYTAAIASGIPASQVYLDNAVVLPQPDGTEWRPKNFTSDFQGPITMREGLRRSINMIAIKVGMEVGLETVAQTARRMGIGTEIERFESTAIGAAEVIPMEMTSAYGTFATLGTKARPYSVARVESADGEVLWEAVPETQRVLDASVARIMVSMLESVVSAGTGTAVRRSLPPEVPAAGKTGTTNESSNVWFGGFTPNLVGLVWFGMDRPIQIRPGATGGADAAPVWGAFMRDVYYGTTDEDSDISFEPMLPIPEPWPMVAGLTTRRVDSRTGKRASEWCPEEDAYTELYLPRTEPTELCDRSGDDLLNRLRVRR